ncbi:Fc.00g030810.m01.CDS01 [Cosmosporella sp. VM-42]
MSSSAIPGWGAVLRPGVLSIDIGMSSTRMAIARLDAIQRLDSEDLDAILHVVQYRDPKRAAMLHYTDWELPGMFNPFETDEPPEKCLLYSSEGSPYVIPVKMFFYILRMSILDETGHYEELDQIHQTVPQLGIFWRLYKRYTAKRQVEIFEHMDRVYRCHLALLREESKKAADTKHIQITKIALAAPPNWDKWMAREYLQRIKDQWPEVEESDIFLVSEATGVANYLIATQKERLRARNTNEILLCDFGGHTFNQSRFRIDFADDDVSFFSIRDDTCQHGGMECHNSMVNLAMVMEIEKDRQSEEKKHGIKHQYTSEELECIHKSIHDAYLTQRQNINGGKLYLYAHERPGIGKRTLKLRDRKSRQIYETYVMKPIKDFLRIAKRVSPNAEVFVTGGSFRNIEAREKVISGLDRLGLSHRISDELWDTARISSLLVVRGTLISVLLQLTAEEFIMKSAITVDYNISQTPTIISRGEPTEAKIVVESQGRKGTVTLSCAPQAPATGVKSALREKTYHFTQFSLDRGIYMMSMTYCQRDNEGREGDFLRFEARPDPSQDFSLGGSREELIKYIPVYYEPTQRVLFVDIDYKGVVPPTNFFFWNKPRSDLETKRSMWQEHLEVIETYTMAMKSVTRREDDDLERIRSPSPTSENEGGGEGEGEEEEEGGHENLQQTAAAGLHQLNHAQGNNIQEDAERFVEQTLHDSPYDFPDDEPPGRLGNHALSRMNETPCPPGPRR